MRDTEHNAGANLRLHTRGNRMLALVALLVELFGVGLALAAFRSHYLAEQGVVVAAAIVSAVALGLVAWDNQSR